MGQLFTTAYRGLIVLLVMLLVMAGTLLGLGTSPAVADVETVTGSAFGYFTDVSLFGGPSEERGPEPVVELQPDASNSPEDASVASASAQYGPAEVFRSGPIDVHTEGALGAEGSVTSSSAVQGDPNPDDRPGPFLYDAVESTCTADEDGVTATTTITNGILETQYDEETQEPTQIEDVPTNPEPNYTRQGTLDHVGDSYEIVFNEQIENADGSITVNAAHMYLQGPTAVGDVIIGQSVCGVTATTTPTTTVPTTTVPTTTVPTTTVPTTTVPTTTVPTTTVPTTTVPTTDPVTTTTVPGDSDGDGTGGVTEVAGSAFGYLTDVGLFGGPAEKRGPEPTVELAPDASNSPQDASLDSASAQYGPAELFRSGRIAVHTEGALGAEGYVTSSSSVQGDPNPEERPGPFLYDAVESTCTADADGVTASTTITGGVLETKYDENTQEATESEQLPTEPAPNDTREGTLDHVGDSYRIVFNEQITNGDGSITVNAAHMYLLGPTAEGEMIIGQSVCAMGASTSGTGTSGGSGDAGDAGGRSGGSGSLARTGTEPIPLVMVGLGLLLTGLGTVALQSGRLGRVEDLHR